MKIAILCLPGIGDSLMATPMIRVLRKNYPKAKIDLICMFGGVAYCFKNNKNINKIYKLSLYNEPLLQGIWEILQLRKNTYDVSFLTFPAYRREYHIVQFLIGARKRISHIFSKGFVREMNFLDTIRIKADTSAHNVINNLNLLKTVNLKTYKKMTKLFYDLTLDIHDKEYGKKYVKDTGWDKKDIIGIHPGSINSSAGLYKRWPIKKFASLVNSLIKKGKKIFIFVGPFEIELGRQIEKLTNNNRYCKIITGTSFGQSLGILSQVSCLISNDNGFAHIANALRIKGIVLFGPTNPLWCCPVDKKYATPIRKAKFTPWFRNDMKVTHPPRGIHSGMGAISVTDVLQALSRI